MTPFMGPRSGRVRPSSSGLNNCQGLLGKHEEHEGWSFTAYFRRIQKSNKFLYLLIVTCMSLYICVFWKTLYVLDLYIEKNTLWKHLIQNTHAPSKASKASKALTAQDEKKYLIFVPVDSQGEGNVVGGLLAAHLLGLEFGRTVCVSTTYTSFLKAFEPIHPKARTECYALPQVPPEDGNRIVQLFNYGTGPPNECRIQALLASAEQVLYYVGNTYPRWRPIPPNFFFQYYCPTDALSNTLPQLDNITVVVHLRQPDPFGGDSRRGLDDATLELLGQTLPSNTFLVTNRVAWYDYFEESFGWSHPNWVEVRHSIKEMRVSWGKRINKRRINPTPRKTVGADPSLQLWSDWYTILQANRVYHTHSDFSLSAIHWMDIESKTIMGVVDTKTTQGESLELALWDESWRRDGETQPLIDRSRDDLLNCDGDDS